MEWRDEKKTLTEEEKKRRKEGLARPELEKEREWNGEMEKNL